LVVRALRALKFSHVDFWCRSISLRLRAHAGNSRPGATRKPSLIVTVDNGVSSIEGVEAARALGIPVL